MKRRPKRDDAARLKALRAEVRRLRGQVRRVEEDKRALQERNAFLNPRAGAGESEDILMPRHSLVLLDRLHAYRADACKLLRRPRSPVTASDLMPP